MMQLPAKIGKYELEEFLGGGMSHVYRARDTVLGRTVALKILTEAGCADSDAKARFLQEARMAGNIVHENIVNIYDFGEEQGRPYMVMEFLRGESLKDAIQGGRLGRLAQRLSLALQIARALEYIHSKNIIHRDVKPDNIHVDLTGKIKLMDFGIAKAEGFALTRAGFTLGTPFYMAPEQVLGHKVTLLVDVYAFGVLLFELLTGVRAVTGDTVEKIFEKILHQPLELGPLRHAAIPAPVIALVERCAAKEPAARPQDFHSISLELDRLIENPAGRRPASTGVAAPGWLQKLPSALQSPLGLTISTAAVVFATLSLFYVLIAALR